MFLEACHFLYPAIHYDIVTSYIECRHILHFKRPISITSFQMWNLIKIYHYDALHPNVLTESD